MGFRESIRQIEACYLLYKLLENAKEFNSICSASFNVILEGVYRKDIKHKNNINSFSDQFISYKKRAFYLTKIRITDSKDTIYFPVLKTDSINRMPKAIHVLTNCDNFYIYYNLDRDGNGCYKKINHVPKKKIKERIDVLAVFYSIITRERFFVEENQYLKAMLFKTIFNSKNTENSSCDETDKIIDEASRLIIECFKNEIYSDVQPFTIDTNIQYLDPYIICNAFINTYNKLSPPHRAIIRDIFDENHRGKLGE